ncbi:MAG: CHASE2 domain-containing protein [Verrucomicrobiae bacterium]|nr:CHASE2 domain-containing protein [Verrucomicrobiae bacterium]
MLHRPKWIVVIVGIFVFWLTQTEWLTNEKWWQKAEGTLIDRCYLNRPFKNPDPDIMLVGIQNSTISLDELAPEEIAASPALQLMQQPWPWNREVYAAVLEKLMAAGAKVVVFDFVFAQQTDGDDVFARALLKYKDHVVIGAQFSPEESNGEILLKYTTPNAGLLLPGTENIIGMVNLWADGDEIQRRGKYRTSIERETSLQPGIAPVMRAKLAKMVKDGKAPDKLLHMSALAAKKFAGHVETPPYDRANFIDFSGPKGTYDALPLEKVFVDKLWKAPPFKGGIIFSNKIVVVGPMADIFHDIHTTPFGDMPGPEIQAQMMATLLQNGSLSEPLDAVNFWLALGTVVLALLICFGIPQASLKGVLLAGMAAAFFAICQYAFNRHNLVIPLMRPLLCFVVTGAFGIIFEYSMEQLERRRYRHIFNRYVSKNVAKVILEDTRSVEDSLRGIKKPVTILFSDIRGFTTMTEMTDADKLVAQLNEYFGEMVDIIQEKNSGTLQKFIGDAIMAAWGDTHTLGSSEDARRAVSAALAMRPGLAKLNAMWKDNPDRQQYATGIGVNHGEVVYGNIGSKNRTELTVLGDGVNLAARLESSTKQFHTDILVGEEAEKLTREHFIYRNVGAIAFKGKTRPVETFTLISDRTVPPPGWLRTYHEAITHYRQRKFKEAIVLFDAVQKQIGQQDYLCEMYTLRCAALSESPPPENWDGSFTLSEK